MNKKDDSRKKIWKRLPPTFFGLVMILLSPLVPVLASPGGSISVTVKDPSDAVIVEATVILRNLETGGQQLGHTNEQGVFSYVDLPPGDFEIAVHCVGFRPFRRTGLGIGPNTALQIEAKLALDAHSDAISVSADDLEVDTTETQIGESFTAKKIDAVPVNGRSFTDLLALQPGIIPASSAQPNAVVMAGAASTPPSGDLDLGNTSVSGQRETANGFVVNGTTVQEDFNMGTAVVPNLDSIQEFRVLTGNFEAKYGNYSGGQVMVVTKSGDSHFHGSVFDFLRNTDLDARSFFSSERAKFNRHQFGGTLGGPIKENTAFFFVDYQGTRMTQGVDTGLISVPSPLDRMGNLSDLASSLTGKVNGQYWAGLLSQKLGYTVYPGEPYYTPGCVSSSSCVFPNAQIPQSIWSKPASHLLPYIPPPNQGVNLFSTSVYNETLRDDKGAIRIDTNTRWGALSTYYSLDTFFLDNPYPTGQGGASVPGFNAVSLGRAQLFILGITKALGPKTVNEFHFGYLRFANIVGQPVGGVGPSLASQGFEEGSGTLGIVPLDPKIEGIENVTFNDFTFGVDVTGEKQVNNTYQWTDNFSTVVGKHTFEIGGGYHFDQININPDAVYNGSFQFTGSETGSDFADFLLGVASYYRQGASKSFYLRNKYIGLYGQDRWQVSTNLTLNYGLRWDVLPPWSEKYNQLQTLVLGQQSVVYPGAPQGLVFPGDPGIPRTLASTKYTNFAPRLGLAYAPNFHSGLPGKLFGGSGKTSVRACGIRALLHGV